MAEQSAYPLSWPLGWPRTREPQRSRFGTYYKKPSLAAGRDGVLAELARLGALGIVISTNIELRRDGLPYSNRTEPRDKGAAVYFTLKNKPRVLACDRWSTVGDNLHAIAKHIEALRGQDRWGVGSVEQAFAGYAALPERSETESCWAVLGVRMDATPAQIQQAYRDLARSWHPDTGGSNELMTKLNRARDEALASLGGTSRG